MKSYKKKIQICFLFWWGGKSIHLGQNPLFFFCFSCDLLFPFLLACNNFIFPTIEQPEKENPSQPASKGKIKSGQNGKARQQFHGLSN